MKEIFSRNTALFMGVTIVAGAATLDPAAGQTRSWSASGGNESIVISDCTDCGEDLGMMVACEGAGRPAEVTVPWAAVENGREGARAAVSFNVDGQVFTFEATTVLWGLVGYLPSFRLSPRDPLIAALQSGRSAWVSFGSANVEISLRGSRDAFEIFKAHCGWNSAGGFDQPTGTQPWIDLSQIGSSGNATATGGQGDNGARWFTTNYTNAETGRTGMSLTFGVPQTDEIAFNATCESGNSGPYIPIMLMVDFGDQPNGVPLDVVFRSAGSESRFNGMVDFLSSESAGVRLAVSIDDPVWAATQSGQPLSFGAANLEPVTVSSPGSAVMIGAFLSSCRGMFSG